MPFLPSHLTDGALLRTTDATWHLFQVHTQHMAAAAHTHIYTHCTYVQHSPRGKEGIAFGSPLQGYCCSWPPRFRHLMSRPQYAIKTPRMRRPPDSKHPTDVLPYPQEYHSEEIVMAKISLLGCCICFFFSIQVCPFPMAH